MKNLLFLVFIMFGTFAAAAELEVLSNPLECDVLIDTPNGKKNLGKTPLKMDLEGLKSAHGLSGVVNISVKKAGFKNFDIIIPMITRTNVKINASLDVEQDIKLTQDFDLLTADLFDTLRMMRGKDYKSAYAKLDALEKKFPHFSIIYEMKGAILYLQNEYKMSLNYYRKAFGINSQNREAYKMKTYLEKKFGIADGQELEGDKK